MSTIKKEGGRDMGLKKIGALVSISMMLLGSSLSVSAEEIQPAGYHVYDIDENQASDTWYGISRGAYLQAGIAKISKGSAAKYVTCSGTTFAHRACDRVFVRIYLDQSNNGTSGWWTVNYWTGENYNNSTAHVSVADYEITRGKYYSVQGSHSVTEGETTEVTTTCTDALYFD